MAFVGYCVVGFLLKRAGVRDHEFENSNGIAWLLKFRFWAGHRWYIRAVGLTTLVAFLISWLLFFFAVAAVLVSVFTVATT